MLFVLVAALQSDVANLRSSQSGTGDGFEQLDRVEAKLERFQETLKADGINVEHRPFESSFAEMGGAATTQAQLEHAQAKLTAVNLKMRADVQSLEELSRQQDEADLHPESSLLQTGEHPDRWAKDKAERKEAHEAIEQELKDDGDEFDKAATAIPPKESFLQTEPDLATIHAKISALKEKDRTVVAQLHDDQREFAQLLARPSGSLLQKSGFDELSEPVPPGLGAAASKLQMVQAELRRQDQSYRSAGSLVEETPAADAVADPPAGEPLDKPADDALAKFEKATDDLDKVDFQRDAERLQESVATGSATSFAEAGRAKKSKGKYGYDAALAGEVEGLGTVDPSDILDGAGSLLNGAPAAQVGDPLAAAQQGGAMLARDLLAFKDADSAHKQAPGSLLAGLELPDGRARPISTW